MSQVGGHLSIERRLKGLLLLRDQDLALVDWLFRGLLRLLLLKVRVMGFLVLGILLRLLFGLVHLSHLLLLLDLLQVELVEVLLLLDLGCVRLHLGVLLLWLLLLGW